MLNRSILIVHLKQPFVDWINTTEPDATALLESELEGWYVDEVLWPKNRSLNVFRQRCDLELHTVWKRQEVRRCTTTKTRQSVAGLNRQDLTIPNSLSQV